MKLKTGLWPIGVATLVLVASCSGMSGSGSEKAKDPNGDGQTVQRPGYANSQYPDPAPIKEQANPQAVQIGGKPVIQACNVLTVADLSALGIQIDSRPDANGAAFERRYLVGDGSGPLRSSELTYAQALTSGVNHCVYTLQDNQGNQTHEELAVAVSQPAYVPTVDTKPYLDDGDPSLTVGPVKVFSKRRKTDSPSDASGDAVLVLGDTLVDFDFELKADKNAAKLQDLGKKIAENFAKQVNSPAGANIIGYDSAAFPKSVAQPCPMLTPDAVTPAIGTDASPMVAESPGTAVGDMIMANSTQHNYVQIDCERGTGHDNGIDRRALHLTALSFLSDDAAKGYVASAPNDGQSVPAQVGDEAQVRSKGETNGEVLFRKGRFVFKLYLADHSAAPNGISGADATRLLVPAAQKMISAFHEQ
ncbi:hypothetical protein ATK30_2745 [Amycolatopsis echigonensis]|uniref:Uncharacterized protein n=1 Tax=Amycolatopsis echigonensis TaxID=2576905 RepID=A0A2N3WDN1_9PSEU|nr:hypothetical protein [Amycolatopsis niigatensis]PKV91957.1 hypothetical protein ATK30_2745 [Amycolatopsis niigatensis]